MFILTIFSMQWLSEINLDGIAVASAPESNIIEQLHLFTAPCLLNLFVGLGELILAILTASFGHSDL